MPDKRLEVNDKQIELLKELLTEKLHTCDENISRYHGMHTGVIKRSQVLTEEQCKQIEERLRDRRREMQIIFDKLCKC